MAYQLPHPFDATVEDLTRAVQAVPRNPVLARDYDGSKTSWSGSAKPRPLCMAQHMRA